MTNSVQEKITFSVVEGKLWLPIRTKPLHEFRLYEYFKERDIPVYLPVLARLRTKNISMSKKMYHYHDTVLRPMLPSYVFAQLDEAERKAVWGSQSVVHVLQVPDYMQHDFIDELKGVSMMEELAKSRKLEYHGEIQVNDCFTIESPSQFAGVKGYLVSKNPKKYLWIVKLALIGEGYIDAVIDPSEFTFHKLP